MINICVFEDDGYKSLFPLTYYRPVYDLLLGIDTLFDKVYRYFDYANITLHCRSFLKPALKIRYPNTNINNINEGAPCLLLNGRVVMNDRLFKIFSENASQYDLLFTNRGKIVALYLRGKNLEYMTKALEKETSSKEIIKYLRPKCVAKELDDVYMIENVWDFYDINSFLINEDFKYKKQPGIIKGDIHPFTAMYNENNVFVGKGACIEDFVTLNAKSGAIFIDEGAIIHSGTRIEGPAFIGKNTQVFGGSIKASSIANNCKIAGEVSHSIISAYTNKAHLGFVGHSYIGEWVNLGANTTISNLKNTYGTIQIEQNNQSIDSGLQFLGATIGDHVKTGIGSLIHSGTTIGFGSNIFGTQMHPKQIAPFTWGGDGDYESYKLEKFYEVTEKVLERRQKELKEDEKSVLKLLYDSTRNKKVVVKK